jgi:hypothetical protein
MVARIATGEIEEPTAPDDGKDPAAKALRKKGAWLALNPYRWSVGRRSPCSAWKNSS